SAYGNGHDVGYGVEGKDRFSVLFGDGEADVGSVLCPTLTVVEVPAFIEGYLCFVESRRNCRCGVGRSTVAVDVLQQRAQAPWLPVVRTADFALVAAGYVGDDRVHAVRDPVSVVIVDETDGRIFCQREGDVCTVGFGVKSIVHVPTTVEGDFVFVIACGQVKGGRPQLIFFIEGECSRFAIRLPVAVTTEHTLYRAGNDD